MTIEIKYEFNPNLENPFVASTYINEKYVVAVSDSSFAEAKTKLLQKAESFKYVDVPEVEQVEL